VTSFSLHQVAITQEPTTHLVAETKEPSIVVTQEPATAETQEPATDFIPEIQESDDQGATTVAVTQEPATHSVAETQELAIVITQEPATAETKEPTADFIPEIQESHAQGAETLFSLHQVAETQESVVDFVAAPQEPATEAVTITQKPVTPLDTPMTDQQPEPTMASLLQENEFLRSELEAYKKELVMAKEAYDRELNLYTLAHVAAMAEKNTKDDQYREYMCNQCGDIYDQAGYKVVQIPMPGASPAPTTFAVKKEERPTVTQEPVGPSKIPKSKANLQEPWPTTTVKSEALIFISKVIQTLSVDESAPPGKISTPTFVEQATQTLPRPTTYDAETQILPIDESTPPGKISTPTLVEQDPLRLYLSLPLAMLKHKLNHGMSR
jgi:hypothetical protein